MSSRTRVFFLSLLLILVVLISFYGVGKNDFVNWDDEKNFLGNAGFRGLGWEQIQWAFSTYWLGVFQPVAWLILEMQFVGWGIAPAGYHYLSVLLHAGNCLLLFFLLKRLFQGSVEKEGLLDRAAFWAAALFAVHPLRVEVVAWASCQPYLPAAFFSLLCLHAFLSFQKTGKNKWLVASGIFYSASVFSKVVAISLPVVLLILDKRAEKKRLRWPAFLSFGLIALLAIRFAFLARDSMDDPVHMDRYAWSSRLAQAAFGVHFPLLKSLWPKEFTPYYPLPLRFHFYDWPYLGWLISALFLCFFLLHFRKKWPAPFHLWLSYCALLFPTLGFLRYSEQLSADRYTYLPCMLLSVAVAQVFLWLFRALEHRGLSWAKPGVGVLLATPLVFLMIESNQLVAAWHDSISLWAHALKNGSSGSADAHNNLAIALDERGGRPQALKEFDRALEINSEYVEAYLNRGITLAKMGRLEEAIASFDRAITLSPLYGEAFSNLGFAYLQQGNLSQARYALEEAVRLDPHSAGAQNNLGVVYSRLPEKRSETTRLFREAVRLDPLHIAARNNLALNLIEQGKDLEAELELKEVLRVNPGFLEAQHQLETLLARRPPFVK